MDNLNHHSESSHPRMLLVEVTQRCNLYCVMCARRVDHRPTGDLSLEMFKNLEGVLPHIAMVIVSGHGEALLHKDFFEMLRICHNAGCPTRIITNATLIDDDAAKKLVTYGLDELVVSIDAAEKGLFDYIRTGASFDTVVNNIRRVARFKRELNSTMPRLMFEMVGMKMNIHQLPPLVKLAKELGVDHIGIATLAEHSDEMRGQNLCNHPRLLKQYLDEAEKLAGELGVKIECGKPYLEACRGTNGPPGFAARARRAMNILRNTARGMRTPAGRTDLLRRASRKLEHKLISAHIIEQRRIVYTKMHCTDPWEFSFIRWDGKVRPCCSSDRILGDLAENTFEEIWTSDSYRTFRHMVSSGKPPEECLRCPTRRRTSFRE